MLNTDELRLIGFNLPDGTIGRMRDLDHITTKTPEGAIRDWVRVQGRKNRTWMLDAE